MDRRDFSQGWLHQLLGGVLACYTLLNLKSVSGWLMPQTPLPGYVEALAWGRVQQDVGLMASAGTLFVILAGMVAMHFVLAVQARSQILRPDSPEGNRLRDPNRASLSRLALLATGSLLVPLLMGNWVLMNWQPELLQPEYWRVNGMPLEGIGLLMLSIVLLVHCCIGLWRLGGLWWPPRLRSEGYPPEHVLGRYLLLLSTVMFLHWVAPWLVHHNGVL